MACQGMIILLFFSIIMMTSSVCGTNNKIVLLSLYQNAANASLVSQQTYFVDQCQVGTTGASYTACDGKFVIANYGCNDDCSECKYTDRHPVGQRIGTGEWTCVDEVPPFNDQVMVTRMYNNNTCVNGTQALPAQIQVANDKCTPATTKNIWLGLVCSDGVPYSTTCTRSDCAPSYCTFVKIYDWGNCLRNGIVGCGYKGYSP
eukprot:TRINITY_DN9913_c0_g1_i2.p1 TRINITY_DN9913_c0_g1~~TRINITY_DN9913_c0_g1_i2.p1  ORF type:complete len:203 (-),score=24.29 TRINITY_DN9913_c0_g1_i2:121-729(-)